MLKSTENNAETTLNAHTYDVLSDVLGSLRICGSILLNEDYAAPWAVSIPGADKLGNLLKLGNDVRAVAFHFVKRGYIEITPDAGEPITLEAGEIAICFGGCAHQLSQGSGATVVPVEKFLAGAQNPFQPDEKLRVRSTSLMCGVFMLHNVELNPLLASLPPLLHASTIRPDSLSNLSGVMERMALETEQKSFGSTYVIERLLELLCAEALRSYLDNHPPSASGWLSGLKDPIVSRAIAMIHAKPGNRWSVDRLASEVAMSPSRFAARFSAAIGDSPMAYVAKWRMHIAGRLLNDTRQGVGEIAADVGYDNAAAFNRAFKKHLGLPPAAWRSRQQRHVAMSTGGSG